MTPLAISNKDARRLWLSAQGLSEAPTGPLDLDAIVRRLGFVQLDSIQVVARAHHHILWSRNQNYREPMLGRLMTRDRAVFEHFTHDASILPMATYPMWRRRFGQLERKTRDWGGPDGMLDDQGRADLLDRIRQEGPLSTRAFDTKTSGAGEMWSRPPHKRTLDHLWYAGVLATHRREGFVKVYDLAERIIPDAVRSVEMEDTAQIDWLCRAALDRLAFATPGELKRFWDAVSVAEAKAWVDQRGGEPTPVDIETADGGTLSALAPADIETRLAQVPAATSRLRILNPFDPVSRDRTRLARLFGFDYRIEIFTPAAQRRWGYYVYPLLEGDRFVGRIEAKADRKAGVLNALALWPEAGVAWTAARQHKLDAELDRLARFIGVGRVDWARDAQR